MPPRWRRGSPLRPLAAIIRWVAISGVPSGWPLRDGATVLGTGQGFAAADLGLLVVSAPDNGGESALLTLTVSTSEGGGTSAVEILSVTASGVAEAPVFGATTVWHGSEEGPVTARGRTATTRADRSPTAALARIPAGSTGRGSPVVLD